MNVQDVLNRLQTANDCMTASMDQKDPSDAINTFLRLTGHNVCADRVAIYEIRNEGFACTYEWASCPENATPPELMELKKPDHPSEWWEALSRRAPLMVLNMDDWREREPDIWKLLTSFGIHSIVICAVFAEKENFGFVAFVNPDEKRVHPLTQFYSLDARYIAVLLRHKRTLDYIFHTERNDRLTGLYNMLTFERGLQPLVKEAQAGTADKVWDVVFFDIPNFRSVNDAHGTSEGNRLLVRVAGILRQELGTDHLSRFEADHFYALVEDDRAEDLAVRVHERILQEPLIGTGLRVGIYTIDGSENDGAHACDRAMLAGEASRGDFHRYVRRFDPSMEDSLNRASYLIRHVDEAVEKGWIQVYYQPIYDHLSGKVASFEALSRWNDPTYGFMSPGIFIPVLEEAHLLYKVDLEVLNQVCRRMQHLGAEDETYYHTSVNLSRNDLELPGIHEKINAIVDSYGIEHGRIAVEITETAVADHALLIHEHIARFHADGYEVWLDDFGSGYSSLNTLGRFDFDLLKIDMQFLRDPNERTADLLTSMVATGKTLGILCLTEGVENEEQMRFWSGIGCTYLQGFCFSKPLPAEEADSLLKEKGIGRESVEDNAFYKTLARVEVLPQREKGVLSISILMKDDQGLHTIFINSAGRDWLREMGADSLEEADRLKTKGTADVFRTLNRAMRQVDAQGGVAELAYHDPRLPGRLRVSLLSAQGGKRAYLITATRVGDLVADFNIADLADGVPGAVLICEAHGSQRLLYANERCLKLFGCTSQVGLSEFANDSFLDLVHPDDRSRVAHGERIRLNEDKEGKVAYLNYRVRQADGSWLPVLDAGQLINQGRYGRVFFIILWDARKLSRSLAGMQNGALCREAVVQQTK
jgi:diguanylate cyclase (GGDEF)-like protein/PAS domain S-box-containing protein